MLEIGGGPDFPREPVHAECFSELRPKDLYRDRAIVPEIAGKVDGRRAAFTELALDVIAVLKGTAKTGEDGVRQRSLYLRWRWSQPERCQPGSSAATQIHETYVTPRQFVCCTTTTRDDGATGNTGLATRRWIESVAAKLVIPAVVARATVRQP
jgi:hypothetical protein